jgi:hypothetical protein
MSVIIPGCPLNCSDFVLPQAEADECAPDWSFGQIDHIYMAPQDAPAFTNYGSLAEWTTRLSNTSFDANAVRFFHVIGDMPEAETSEIQISLDRMIQVQKTFVINARTEETGSLNHEFLRFLECGVFVRIWWTAGNKYIYGGNDGIEVSVKANEIIPESREELITIQFTFTWKSKHSPERTTSPFA